MVRVKGLEPPRPKPLVPKTSASTNSATPAYYLKLLSQAKFCPLYLIRLGAISIVRGDIGVKI